MSRTIRSSAIGASAPSRRGRVPKRRDVPAPPRPGDVVLELEHVDVAYDGRPVVVDVSLTVRAGEVVSLVGPNGAGKSTLLAAIAGDVPLDGGRITLCSDPIDSWDAAGLAMRRAVLTQDASVTFPFRSGEVVRMGRAPWEGTPAEADDDMIVDAAMRASETLPLADRTFTSMSGGERGRVSFARVLAQAAPVLLLDEPTAAMDVRHQEMVMRVAREYAAAGSAVVVVVHALDVAAAWSDRVAVLADGALRAVGAPAEVMTAPLLSEVYGCPIEVLPHPRGGIIILPVRRGKA